MAYGDGNRGVGGALAFFLVTLGIISPLYLIFTTWRELSDPNLAALGTSMTHSITLGEIALVAVVCLLCWFICFCFLRIWKPITVVIGVAGLWVIALLVAFGEPLILSSIIGMPFGTLVKLSGVAIIRPFIYAGIWSVFLLVSKDVRRTYREPAPQHVDDVFE